MRASAGVKMLAFDFKWCNDIVVEVCFVSEGVDIDVSKSLEYYKCTCVVTKWCELLTVSSQKYELYRWFLLRFELRSSKFSCTKVSWN